MKDPLSIPRFIALVLDSPAEGDVSKTWFKCVKENAPSGVLLNIPTSDDQGMPRTVCMVHREQGTKHLYMVPLSRDLAENEGEAIVDAFTDLQPDLDFDIQSSATHGEEQESHAPVMVDQDRYVSLCTAWAKRQHDTWVKDREANGWRYGTTLSMSEKTNPLIRPWEQLPEKYRKPDLDEPQALLDLLNDQGYAVVTKGELQAMLNLMRISNPLLRESSGEYQGSKNLSKAIAYAMHAVKNAKGLDKDELRKAVSYFNVARTLWKLGDMQGVNGALTKGIEILDRAEPIEEDFFKKKTAAVPTDRLAQATRTGDERQAARDWDPVQPHKPQQGVIGRQQPSAPAPAPANEPRVFGKRR